MVSVETALEIVKKNSFPITDWEWKTVKDALNDQLYEAVVSPIDMPPFPQSAMDGYALCLHDSNSYTIIDEIKAGDAHQPVLKLGDAVRIFTGAAVPATATAVIMQEKTNVDGKLLTIQKKVILGENIRPKGEQTQAGVVVEKSGAIVTPATIGYFSTLGITKIKVVKKPTIAIVVTGNELLQAGNPLTHGKIYESNSVMLMAAFQSVACHNVSLYRVKDDYEATKAMLNKAIQSCDLLVVSGGISVGDYDYVGKALLDLSVKEHFYKVKQKPGKPLFYGQKGNCSIFALPGNPAAALTCFYVYVCTALCRISNLPLANLKQTEAITETIIPKVGYRAQFLKAYVSNGTVKMLNSQSSAMLNSYASANALIYLTENYQAKAKGDTVTLIHLPV